MTVSTIFKVPAFYNDNPLQSIHESSKSPESGNFQCAPVWLTDERARYTRSSWSSMLKQGSNHPAAAAKSLQSCLTLCDPIDGSPPGYPIPGISQARTLEWVAISFSNAWKWKWSLSVMSDSSRPHGLQLTRLLRPWDFPGKSTGGGAICWVCFNGRGPHLGLRQEPQVSSPFLTQIEACLQWTV